LNTETEKGANRHYVLDTSAFLTLFEKECGADTVQNILEQARRGEAIVFTSFVSFVEVFYITFQEEGEAAAVNRVNLMNRLDIHTVESSRELGFIAGRKQLTGFLLPMPGLPLQQYHTGRNWCTKILNSTN